MSEDEQQPQPEQTKRKVTPVFVSDQADGTTTAATAVDLYDGRPRETIEAESPEAAVHWDVRFWHR